MLNLQFPLSLICLNLHLHTHISCSKEEICWLGESSIEFTLGYTFRWIQPSLCCMMITLKVILIVGSALHFKRELNGFIWFSYVIGLCIKGHTLLCLPCFTDLIRKLNFVYALLRWLEKLSNTFIYMPTSWSIICINVTCDEFQNFRPITQAKALKDILLCLGKSCVI